MKLPRGFKMNLKMNLSLVFSPCFLLGRPVTCCAAEHIPSFFDRVLSLGGGSAARQDASEYHHHPGEL